MERGEEMRMNMSGECSALFALDNQMYFYITFWFLEKDWLVPRFCLWLNFAQFQTSGKKSKLLHEKKNLRSWLLIHDEKVHKRFVWQRRMWMIRVRVRVWVDNWCDKDDFQPMIFDWLAFMLALFYILSVSFLYIV